jgi:hypothetical protein
MMRSTVPTTWIPITHTTRNTSHTLHSDSALHTYSTIYRNRHTQILADNNNVFLLRKESLAARNLVQDVGIGNQIGQPHGRWRFDMFLRFSLYYGKYPSRMFCFPLFFCYCLSTCNSGTVSQRFIVCVFYLLRNMRTSKTICTCPKICPPLACSSRVLNQTPTRSQITQSMPLT